MSLANTYAKALYEASVELRLDASAQDQVAQDLFELGEMIQSSDSLKRVLFGPVTSTREKSSVVSSLATRCGFHSLTTHFLLLLAQKERLAFLVPMSEALLEVKTLAKGGVLGRLVSAEKMGAADVRELELAFTQKMGKTVVLTQKTDSSLLAGIQVTLQGVTYDGSLKTQLKKLRDDVITAKFA